MLIAAFVKGIVIGFFFAAPIGPLGILCARRTLVSGAWGGFMVGLSSASADVVYALIAALGVSLTYEYIADHRYWIRLVGGLILIVVGFFTVRSKPDLSSNRTRKRKEAQAFISVFLLGLTNPLVMFAYAAAFSGIGSWGIKSASVSLPGLISGVFLGSLLWSSLLICVVQLLKSRVTPLRFGVVNKITGFLLIAFGIVGCWSGLSGI